MKKLGSFFTGILALTLLLTISPVSIAAQKTPLNGKFSYNQVGVALFSEVKFGAGQTRTAGNGQQVPTVVTYTDALGGKTHYLAAQTAAELFDVYNGVSWNAEKNCIDFSARPKSQIIVVTDGETPPKNPPENSIVITTGVKEKDEADAASTALPTAPKLGQVAGPFMEIPLSGVKMEQRPIVLSDGRLSKSSTGLDQMIHMEPGNGTALVITVINHGKKDVRMNVMRPYTVGAGNYNTFTTVGIAPGKTFVRAFRMDKDAEDLEKSLRLLVDSSGMGWMTDVTFSVEQFSE